MKMNGRQVIQKLLAFSDGESLVVGDMEWTSVGDRFGVPCVDGASMFVRREDLYGYFKKEAEYDVAP
jgi:hypothetical protein